MVREYSGKSKFYLRYLGGEEMALTPEFMTAVRNNNLLRVRIMLKDSLLVDKRFAQFTEMRQYAERMGVNFWMEKTEELEMKPQESWNADLMNLELTKLVNDFTKEHLVYCQAIIERVYGINSPINQAYSATRTTPTTGSSNYANGGGIPAGQSSNDEDYKAILRGVTRMDRILKGNKTDDGRTWTFDDIEALQVAAKRVSRACENIKSRR